jgi:hypothetical protein
VERDAIVRSRRRDQALEALEFEREREQALADQIGAILVEAEGPRVDQEAFGRMEEVDVALVRELLVEPEWAFEEEGAELGDDPDAGLAGAEGEQGVDEDEIGRLESEIVRCRDRQRALERYIEALAV